jgi:hypothetical protein
MATDFIVIDANAVQNLFAGGGTTAWGQLLTGDKKVVLSSVILGELKAAPGVLGEVFENWAAANKVKVVDFELPDLRRPDGTFKLDAGDKVLRALMDPSNESSGDTILIRPPAPPRRLTFSPLYRICSSVALGNLDPVLGSNQLPHTPSTF